MGIFVIAFVVLAGFGAYYVYDLYTTEKERKEYETRRRNSWL